MAAFAQHMQFSSVLGVGYAGALWQAGVEGSHAALSGAMCALAGMLPDLDSESGRPTRELFGVTAAVVPFLLLRRLQHAGFSHDETVLIGGAVYFVIRFGGAWLFRHLTTHRGMFHSLPAAVIAAEATFLVHTGPEAGGRLALAGGVCLGFVSHLILDEISSVDAHGLRVRLNKSAGSAFKLFSANARATLCTWVLLAVLTYAIGIDQGCFQPVHFTVTFPPAAQKPQR